MTSAQPSLFPAPVSPVQHAARWRCDLLEPIPVPGHATAATWAGLSEETRRWPGRNHPKVGAWLAEHWCPATSDSVRFADPMIGIGGLWLRASKLGTLYGCEVERAGARVAQINLIDRENVIRQGDARKWRCPPADLLMFSPPFIQTHSAGATEHQRQIRDAKRLHSMQDFGRSQGNIGRMRGAEFWLAMSRVYDSCRVNTRGVMVVILRNYIRLGAEVDEVGDHLALIREGGFKVVGVHPRDLVRPTGYQQWKVARDASTPWVRYEWAAVAR